MGLADGDAVEHEKLTTRSRPQQSQCCCRKCAENRDSEFFVTIQTRAPRHRLREEELRRLVAVAKDARSLDAVNTVKWMVNRVPLTYPNTRGPRFHFYDKPT